MDSYYLIIHSLLGPLLFIISIVILKYPPGRVNSFYGYRTPRSMRNQKTWKAANRYSSRAMLWMSLACIFIQILAISLFDPGTSIMVGVVAMISGLIMVILITERYLILHFDRSGNPIEK